jgi:hypothetical protein
VIVKKTEELGFASVTLREDGIIKVYILPELKVTVDHIKQITDAIIRVGGGKDFPILIDAALYSFPDENARKFLASNDSKSHALAEAYVIYSLSQKMVAKFYLNFHKPKRPTKIFSNEVDAVKWLSTFL